MFAKVLWPCKATYLRAPGARTWAFGDAIMLPITAATESFFFQFQILLVLGMTYDVQFTPDILDIML